MEVLIQILSSFVDELEALLRQKDEQVDALVTSGTGLQHGLNEGLHSTGNSSAMLLNLAGDSPSGMAHISPSVTPPIATIGLATDAQYNQASQVLWPNWPHNLPTFELLQHL